MSSKKISIITGKKHSGKTTFLQEKIRELRDQGVSVGGIISIGSFKNNVRHDFKLQDISTGEEIDFLSRKGCNTCEKIGRFYINAEAFDFGFKVLKRCLKNEIQIIVLDEIGPLELNNKGWAAILPDLLASDSDLILTIREDLVKGVISRWSINPDRIFKTE